ncbi:hypothetical protein LO762_24520 [Actinocorallia sp. API 0066]|uniref:hypothetical protein n=1 Tax=Actinocorallia sp. API 0066 TaxID=2896846 RepID=UPI001E43693C|nr:hypothetical protein [Actinocorallia sp. API 0066]MCD0452332.1 hypothetical protein [Actinocorallia sp. API 0066]
MSSRTDTERFLRVTLDLVVEVTDAASLRETALADLRVRQPDPAEFEEQHDQIVADETGASALRWLISPEAVLGLVDRIEEIDPVEAMLEISESEGALESAEE